MGLLALVVAATSTSAAADSAGAARPPGCELPAGSLTAKDLPPGASVLDCDAVGRVLRVDGAGVVIPEPGIAVGTEALSDDGTATALQVQVTEDGTISYPKVQTVDEAPRRSTALAAPAGACSDAAYTTNDLKEYGVYNWYIGDGPMPAGLSRRNARIAFSDAIDNITGSFNDCGYDDRVEARARYRGATGNEANISTTGVCTWRDRKSTWDAGNLAGGTVAQACWWSLPSPGVKNDLIEADVRYNRTDFNFTNNPGSRCANRYDVRSVGTHEAGHIFGMGHVGLGHRNLTMYVQSLTCTTRARTLGRGDVRGLRSLY
ncbi:MAG: hypothetical protein WA892_04430 [Ornithinimicrobium sp.]